jgi:hypothetical protein
LSPELDAMSTTLAPIRLAGLKQAVLSDDDSAVLLELQMANGKIFPLELDAAGITLLLRTLLASAAAMPEPPAAVDMSTVVKLPAERLTSARASDGSQWWAMRVGSVDLAIGPLPEEGGATKPVH